MENNANAVRYRIDARQSRFVVQAFAEGLLSMFGHNPTIAVCGFGGDAQFNSGTLRDASLLMLVQAESLAAVGEMSEKDHHEIERAMRAEVLETARYPEIIYMSKSISVGQVSEGRYEAQITGSLSLHGVTRDQLINAQLMIDQHHLRAQGEFALRQSDFNIKPVSALGGTLKVKDELKLSFDIAAAKQG